MKQAAHFLLRHHHHQPRHFLHSRYSALLPTLRCCSFFSTAPTTTTKSPNPSIMMTPNPASDSDSNGPRAVVVAGPSGVGKGTLIEKLRGEFPKLFGFSVSHTSRAPRPGEEDGVHYNFVPADIILAEVAAGKFIEHAEVHGRHYGTSVSAVEKVRTQGKICILDIDVQGCRAARQKQLDAVYVFIAPPSMEALEQRLRGRGTEDESAIKTRLANATAEINAKDEKDLFDHIIVNDDLEVAYGKLKELLKDDIEQAGRAQA